MVHEEVEPQGHQPQGVLSVPLSEDEQRILHEIERRFYESDPAFANQVSQTTLYRHAGRNCKWAAVGFVAGLVLLLVSFASSLWLGGLGFAIMLFCALVIDRNLRKMGRAGWQQMTESMRARNMGDLLGDTRKRLRERFKREE
jgi:Protein of unknown function (DUF3040)